MKQDVPETLPIEFSYPEARLGPLLPAQPDRRAALRVWRRACAEAEIALVSWQRHGGRDAYVRYRAAQDREDAALDVLAAATA